MYKQGEAVDFFCSDAFLDTARIWTWTSLNRLIRGRFRQRHTLSACVRTFVSLHASVHHLPGISLCAAVLCTSFKSRVYRTVTCIYVRYRSTCAVRLRLRGSVTVEKMMRFSAGAACILWYGVGPRDKGQQTRILTWTWMAETEAEMRVMMGRPQETVKPARREHLSSQCDVDWSIVYGQTCVSCVFGRGVPCRVVKASGAGKTSSARFRLWVIFEGAEKAIEFPDTIVDFVRGHLQACG